jgi:hypothetical protein
LDVLFTMSSISRTPSWPSHGAGVIVQLLVVLLLLLLHQPAASTSYKASSASFDNSLHLLRRLLADIFKIFE